MAVFRPKFTDPNTGERRISGVWWYKFYFAGRPIRESAKTESKTLAKQAEQKRRRELEEGFNGIVDRRDERIRTVKELADAYLEDYRLRSKAVPFAEYALGHVARLVGDQMAVEVTEKTIKEFRTARLKEGASPKSRMAKIFMRRDCSIGVGRQDVLDSGCHVADRAQAEPGRGSTLFLPWWLRSA